MAVRGKVVRLLSESPMANLAASLPILIPIADKMKDVMIEILGLPEMVPPLPPKTLTLDPKRWDVRVFSYIDSTPPEHYNGEHIVSCAIEDQATRNEADDYKDVIIVMRKWVEEGVADRLLIQIVNVMHPNPVKVYYKGELIYDSTVDDIKLWVWLPWE